MRLRRACLWLSSALVFVRCGLVTLWRQTPGAGGEIQLTDAMQRLMGSQTFHALKYDGQDYDCGDKLLYLEAFAAMALAHPELGEAARSVLQGVLNRK